MIVSIIPFIPALTPGITNEWTIRKDDDIIYYI